MINNIYVMHGWCPWDTVFISGIHDEQYLWLVSWYTVLMSVYLIHNIHIFQFHDTECLYLLSRNTLHVYIWYQLYTIFMSFMYMIYIVYVWYPWHAIFMSGSRHWCYEVWTQSHRIFPYPISEEVDYLYHSHVPVFVTTTRLIWPASPELCSVPYL